jgi:hypothetical protein
LRYPGADGFAGGLKYGWLDMQKTQKDRKITGSRDDKEEGWVFPVEIGLRDPRSQKRDLGHPSVSPFDTAEGTSFVISLPTLLSESAAPRDDKEEGGCFQWELV